MSRLAAAVFIGGLLIAVVPGYMLVSSVGPCQDFEVHHVMFARLSVGPSLPVPVVELCAHATSLFVLFYAGYVIAAIGTVLLLFARLSLPALAAITIAGIFLALAMPFVPTTDPYSYAFNAYVPFVLKQSPYFAHHLSSGSPVAATLNLILPEEQIRVVNYGPVSVALNSLLVGPFGLISLKAMLIAERAAGAICLVALALMLSMTQSGNSARRQTFIAIALNPLLLFQSVSFAHGDIFMLLLLAAAYVLYRKGRFGFAACLCVLAMETRFTALLAAVVLFIVLLRRKQFADAGRAVIVAAATVAVTWLWSERAYGAFHLTGFSFFYSNYDAPVTIVVTLVLGATALALMLGTFLQAGLGAFMAYVSLRERFYSLMPVAALATLPVFEPWYAQWLAPIAVLTSNTAYRGGIIAFMLLAPTQLYLNMTVQANAPGLRAAFVLCQWIIPLLVYCLFSFERSRSKKAHAAYEV